MGLAKGSSWRERIRGSSKRYLPVLFMVRIGEADDAAANASDVIGTTDTDGVRIGTQGQFGTKPKMLCTRSHRRSCASVRSLRDDLA